MPKIDNTLVPIKTLIYGAGKTRKTTWAGHAASTGRNVVLLDCDKGSSILKTLDDESKSRIDVLNIADSAQFAVACTQLVYLMQMGWDKEAIYWDEQLQSVARSKPMGKPHYEINLNLLSSEDVIILDSWTALVQSLVKRFNFENSVEENEGAKPDWEGYRWAGAMANNILIKLLALPCHVIVVGHSSVYEKYSGTKKNRTLDFSRTQPVSVSNNHSATLAKYFDDVLYFTADVLGNTHVDTSSSLERDGGSRGVPPARWTFGGRQPERELPYGKLLQAYGHGAIVPQPNQAFIYHDQ